MLPASTTARSLFQNNLAVDFIPQYIALHDTCRATKAGTLFIQHNNYLPVKQKEQKENKNNKIYLKTCIMANGAQHASLFLAAGDTKPNVGGAKEFLHQKPYGFFHQIKFDTACFKTPIFFYFYQPRLLQRP